MFKRPFHLLTIKNAAAARSKYMPLTAAAVILFTENSLS